MSGYLTPISSASSSTSSLALPVDFVIRHLNSADIPQVIKLHSSLLPHAYDSTFFRQHLFHSSRRCLIAHLPGQPEAIVGAVSAHISTRIQYPPRKSHDGEPQVKLTTLGVIPEYRRRGIARDLVRAVVKALTTSKQATDGTLVHVRLRTANQDARKFYGGLGSFSEGGVVNNMFRTLPSSQTEGIEVIGRV